MTSPTPTQLLEQARFQALASEARQAFLLEAIAVSLIEAGRAAEPLKADAAPRGPVLEPVLEPEPEPEPSTAPKKKAAPRKRRTPSESTPAPSADTPASQDDLRESANGVS